MKKIIFTFFAAMLFLLNGFGQATVYIEVAEVTATAGQFAQVPVTVISGLDENNGGTAIIQMNFEIPYNMSVVTFVEITNPNPLFPLTFWNASSVDNGTIHLDWAIEDPENPLPVSIPDGQVLFQLRFLCNGGGTSSLNPFGVEFQDIDGIFLPYDMNNGSVTYGTPPVSTTWNGTAPWFTPGNWSNGFPGKSTPAIINGGIVTIDGSKAYTANLTINPGAGVTINAAKTLSVNGNLILESNATQTATGSLLRNGNLTVTGTSVVKRYLTPGVQHFISIPVTTATIADLINPVNPGYLFKYDEPSNAWENPWDPTYSLSPSIGYSVNYDNAETIELSGVLNNDNSYAPTITRVDQRWNLVGNPYPIGLDWTIASGWTKTLVENAIYVWNSNNSQYASFVSGVATNGGSKYIPQFQGFFVRLTTATGTPSLQIKKAARTHGANDTLYMKNEAVANVFRMMISNGTLTDETAIYMTPEATQNWDSDWDACKLFGFNQEAPHIYTQIGEEIYSINGQPISDELYIPLNTKTSTSGSFTVNASGFETFNGNYSFILEDKVTGINHDVKKNPQIILDLNQGETNGRFMLKIFKNTLGIEDPGMNAVNIYSENKTVCLANCPEGKVTVYNMNGVVIASRELPGSSLNKITLNAPTGIYLVSLVAQDNTVTSKVYIK
jgi:hypothetical protein